MRFEAKTAIVTGGGSGIGAATAIRLAEEGAAVVVVDVDESRAADIARHIGGTPVALDIADLAAIPDRLAAAGETDILVNCAGWDRAQPFVDTDETFWRKVIDVNLMGPIAVTHAVLPLMPDGGAVVNISSDAGRVGSSGEVVYSGAKGGIIGFSKALAREMATRGIRVNVVAPGPTETPFLESFDETGKLAQAMKRQTPLGKLATPEDVAAAICFLASADAGHITGQVLSVSGGLTMV